MPHVFISYSRSDRQYAERLHDELLARGFDVWMDTTALEPARDWWQEIERGIEHCGAFVLLVSPASAESHWVNAEVGLAVDWKKPIFPLLLRQRPDERFMFSHLRRFQWEDVTNEELPPERFFTELSRRIAPRPQQGASVAPQPPSHMLAGSDDPISRSEPLREPGQPRRSRSPWVLGAAAVSVMAVVVLLGIGSGLFGGSVPASTPHPLTEIALNQTQAANLAQTATAASWTDTPLPFTPDLTGTYYVFETAVAQTQQAIPTNVPVLPSSTSQVITATFMPPTDTPTSTSTPSPTATPTLSPLEIARTPVTQNADWQPEVQVFDGVEMVLVPAGCFLMGSDASEAGGDEQPVHEVCFEEPYWIDRTEVTNGQFEQFGGVAARQSNWTDADRPREVITWTEAADFCELRGARLPTEAEWEYAARGPDALIYPWGDEFVSENVVWDETSGGQMAAVGSRPGGVSWVGAYDLSGNMWEWVADWYGTYPSERQVNPTGPEISAYRVLRGGSWSDRYPGSLRAAYRYRDYPVFRYSYFGFRCVRLP